MGLSNDHSDQLMGVAGETVLAVAARTLGEKASNVIAAKVNGTLKDLTTILTEPSKIEWLTTQDAEGLSILRHSAAHLLAQAITQLFPGAQPTVGPAIEDGFYHDFYLPNGGVIKEEDLPTIEKRMQELAEKDLPIVRSERTKPEAIAFYQQRDEQYKVWMAEDVPSDIVSFYTQGEFTNMCRGPHVTRTGLLKHFKLTKLAGAYWKGDAKNAMLSRVYGTAWGSAQELTDYLTRLEEAKKRDHRLIGKKMDLFHIQEEAPGMVFWHANGWTIYRVIKQYLEPKLRRFGYQEVNTPMIVDRSLWERSGHWDKYRENMFITEAEGRTFAIKPMNCPDHLQIFKQAIHSYRDLPIRYAEFGSCHRNEPSGSLHGIMRVRGFAQDDGHILCLPEQISSESSAFIEQLMEVYRDFGFTEVGFKLSTRPEKRIGSDEVWDQAEQALTDVLNRTGQPWQLVPGDGAFYGPKIEFSLKDCLGRVWQCGTLQVDFFMPERLGASYVASDGSRRFPVMLHRAMLGSLERFIGILLEDTAGKLPWWLAPVQVSVLTIAERHNDYASAIAEQLNTMGYRANADLRNEKVGLKIRENTLANVPVFLIVGDRDQTQQTVSVRMADGTDRGAMSLMQFIETILAPEVASKKRRVN